MDGLLVYCAMEIHSLTDLIEDYRVQTSPNIWQTVKMAASFAAIGLETVPPSLFNHTRSLPHRAAQRRVSLTLLVSCVHTVLMYQMA